MSDSYAERTKKSNNCDTLCNSASWSGSVLYLSPSTPQSGAIYITVIIAHMNHRASNANTFGIQKQMENHAGIAAAPSAVLPAPEKMKKVLEKKPTSARTNCDTPEEVFWPEDLLATDLPNTRILTYGYDSRASRFFAGASSKNGILEHGRDLLDSLASALCQSKGSRADDTDLVDIYQSTSELMFFGTPHRRAGSSYAEWGLIARNIVTAAGFDATDNILRYLKVDSSWLELLREEFDKMLSDKEKPFRSMIYTFQEDRGYKGIRGLTGKIVENGSSGLDISFERKSSINANHMEMFRFVGKEDQGYEKCLVGIERCLKETQAAVERATEEETRDLRSSLYKQHMFYRRDGIVDPHSKAFEWVFLNKSLGFEEWLRTGGGIYWINGLPGSGKRYLHWCTDSVPMKFAFSDQRTLDALKNSDSIVHQAKAAFFFNERGSQDGNSLQAFLHCILYQMLEEIPELSAAVLPIYCGLHPDPDMRKDKWTIGALKSALQAIKNRTYPRLSICLFIDALDEYEGDRGNRDREYRELAKFLKQLTQGSDIDYVHFSFPNITGIFLYSAKRLLGVPSDFKVKSLEEN
ncbi:hypothetical protein K440DRAFT_676224 [Wilcoxina mikolae CBS 423.85]|nr:hypothetical protein K440DRAFT_676224 [Wilcoxina mikolae CBS 423.85]